MASYIGRRKFLATFVGGAAAWPLAARAQQPAMPVIGFLSPGSPEADTNRMNGVRRGLAEIGYVEGQNVAIEYRGAQYQYGHLPALAVDLVSRQVSVIIVVSITPTLAAKAATNTIPIVFSVGGDPVQFSIVTSLNRPVQHHRRIQLKYRSNGKTTGAIARNGPRCGRHRPACKPEQRR